MGGRSQPDGGVRTRGREARAVGRRRRDSLARPVGGAGGRERGRLASAAVVVTTVVPRRGFRFHSMNGGRRRRSSGLSILCARRHILLRARFRRGRSSPQPADRATSAAPVTAYHPYGTYQRRRHVNTSREYSQKSTRYSLLLLLLFV